MNDKKKITIEIDNITNAQAIAIEDMLATWQQLGSWGSSRRTCFYADGDGNFQPKITVDGVKAKHTDLVKEDEKWPDGSGGDYQMDFDLIGWRLREQLG